MKTTFETEHVKKLVTITNSLVCLEENLESALLDIAVLSADNDEGLDAATKLDVLETLALTVTCVKSLKDEVRLLESEISENQESNN